jgi:RNA polymerase sigma-70 factor (ECF subfamily)
MSELSTGVRDEAEEVRRAKQRDSLVWAAWHDAYYPLIYRYAFVRLANPEDAEDVTSQVFLEALKGIHRYEFRGRPIVAWLYGIAHNLVQHRRQELARRPKPIELSEGGAEALLDNSEATDAKLLVWSVLEMLKDEHREILVLRYLLDFPAKEVAAILGKTEQAVYSLQLRALDAARRVLDVKPGPKAASSGQQAA